MILKGSYHHSVQKINQNQEVLKIAQVKVHCLMMNVLKAGEGKVQRERVIFHMFLVNKRKRIMKMIMRVVFLVMIRLLQIVV